MDRSGYGCGKLILAGEHAVVYGVPAIALGIDRGATALARVLASGPSQLHIATWGVRVVEGDTGDLGRAFTALLASARRRRDLVALEVEATTDLPAGGGLGCSAALGVSIARACGATASDDVREDAMAWERIFHGNPSGVDAAVATLGGAVQFIRESEGSVIEPVAPLVPLVFAIGHSGVASSTREMVEAVARRHASHTASVLAIFERIRRVVAEARAAIESGDLAILGDMLDRNQTLLGELALSTAKIDGMCKTARDAGALGAKLTGAGGGGCVVALAESRDAAAEILAAWKAVASDGFVAELHAPRADTPHDSASDLLAAS
jgi:mevalonate kinase